MRGLWTLCALMLCACVTHTVLEPSDTARTERSGAACAPPTIHAVETIADGITVLVSARPRGSEVSITIGARLAPGRQLKFLSPVVLAGSDGKNAKQLEISAFSSGAEGFKVERLYFKPTEALVGTSRMSNLRPPYGPDETFYGPVVLRSNTDSLKVVPPQAEVAGVVHDIKPVHFVLKSVSVPCVQ